MVAYQTVGISVVVLVLIGAGVFGATVLLDSPGTVTRDLPDTAAPGDTIIVKLHFNLSEPQDVTVKETLEGAVNDEKTLTAKDMESGQRFYDVHIPADATGELSFHGTVEELGITVDGDETLEVTGKWQ